MKKSKTEMNTCMAYSRHKEAGVIRMNKVENRVVKGQVVKSEREKIIKSLVKNLDFCIKINAICIQRTSGLNVTRK